MNNFLNNQMNRQISNDDVSIDVISLRSFFFRIFVNVFYSSFRCFFSFLIIIFSIISDLEISLLNASVEKTIQKIFRAENVIETNIAAIVFNFLQIISSNEIAISNRNVEKKTQNEQVFFAKENSNDVERQHSDTASLSSSFNVSKSDNQKNFDFSVDFFALLIEQKTTTLIRIWCEFCILCVKSTFFCVRVANSINCQWCANQKNACVSIKNEFHIFFILSLIDKMFWHH